jgi:hypothetical protein
LRRIEGLISLGVVTDQNFTERRLDLLNVFGEIFAILKIELHLSTFLRRARGGVAAGASVEEDSAAKLLVHQNAGPLFGHSCLDGGFETVIDHLLGGSDFRRLFSGQSSGPSKEFRLERAPMIERQNVKRPVITQRPHTTSLDLR